MGWILFEALLALGVMLAVVWWTFRSRREIEVPSSDSALPAPAAADVPPDSR